MCQWSMVATLLFLDATGDIRAVRLGCRRGSALDQLKYLR